MVVCLFYEFIDTVDIGFDRGRDNIGIGTETVIGTVVVLYLHMYLTDVVATLADGLKKC